MSVRIEIVAENGDDAAVQIARFIGVVTRHFHPTAPPAEPERPAPEKPPLDEQVNSPPAVSTDAGAPAVSTDAGAPAVSTDAGAPAGPSPIQHTRPGRPRDSAEVRAAKLAAKAAKNTPAGEGPAMADPASQPAVENTGSAQPVPLPAGDAVVAPVAGAQAPAAAPAAITEDAMRQALNVLVNTVGGGGDAGMVAGAEILNKYGYARIREIKPEHYANITADAEAAIAKHKAA